VAPKDMHTGGIYESYGRGWLIQPAPNLENQLKEGEWNTLTIVVQGDKVKTLLNGVQMIELSDVKIGASTGKISLQIHDGGSVKVKWRKIELREM
jgi:Domain of Unknown Function (DUF1080)